MHTQSWQPANDTEAALLATLAEDASCVVYADWLEERGDADRAELVRIHAQLRTMKESDIRAIWLQDRLQILARNVDPRWRAHFIPDPVVAEPIVEPPPPPVAPPPRIRRAAPRYYPEVAAPVTYVPSTEPPRWMFVTSALAFAIIVGSIILYWVG